MEQDLPAAPFGVDNGQSPQPTQSPQQTQPGSLYPRPGPPSIPGNPARPEVTDLALPHLTARAHIQPTPPVGAARPYRPLPRPDLAPVPPGLAPAPGVAGAAQPAAPPWAPQDGEQSRFDAFKPVAEAAEASNPEPAAQVRNGRVLAAVLGAAVLLLVVPLSLVWLITRPSDGAAFNPEIGQCVKQSDTTAEPAGCGEPNAYRVTAKVDDPAQCDDPNAPHIRMPAGQGKEQVLCLRSAVADPPAESPAS